MRWSRFHLQFTRTRECAHVPFIFLKQGCAMELKDFPNEFSLRYHAHVMCVYVDAVLKFATDLADDDLENLSHEDKAIYNMLADYLERAAYAADKLKKRVRRQ